MTVMILIEWRSVVKSFLTLSTLTLYTDDRQTAQTVSVPRPFPHATPQKGICLCAATDRNRSCWWAWSRKTSLCADCCQCCPSFACCSPLGWYKKKAESRCKARWMDRGSSCVWQKMTTLVPEWLDALEKFGERNDMEWFSRQGFPTTPSIVGHRCWID